MSEIRSREKRRRWIVLCCDDLRANQGYSIGLACVEEMRVVAEIEADVSTERSARWTLMDLHLFCLGHEVEIAAPKRFVRCGVGEGFVSDDASQWWIGDDDA
jgi:hypothetical protein